MLQEIMRIAQEAGKLFLEASRVTVTEKEGVGNFVTDCDVRVQNYILEQLKQLHPDASFMGEEDEHHSGVPAGDCFVVDPIDGTQNFINGYRHSCVSIGMLRNGVPELGVVYNPYQDNLFWAQRGQGAFWNGNPLKDQGKTLAQSVVLFGTAAYDRNLADPTFRLLRAVFDHALDLRSSGSAALDICYVASGRCNAFFEYHLKPWDYCAASVILEEAGGRISQINGQPLNFSQGVSVLAAGAAAYDEILALARQI